MAWGSYFMGYDAIKAKMRNIARVEQLSALQHCGAAMIAGAITMTLTNPVWVVKTRMCVQNQVSRLDAKVGANTVPGPLLRTVACSLWAPPCAARCR